MKIAAIILAVFIVFMLFLAWALSRAAAIGDRMAEEAWRREKAQEDGDS
jgi:hypothetical protein